MKVLVIGGGGREHAIIKALKKSRRITKLYAAPGNGGIECEAQCVPIKADDVASMTDFAVKEKIDYAAVIPDNPLALGMVDSLAAAGIRCFGPDKAAARIESSKIFAKDLMKKYGIPTASYQTFFDAEKAEGFVKSASFPLVIKADGLALGKGVIIAANKGEALDALKSIMRDKIFGESGSGVVIEECLTGPEVSILAFTDGKTIVPMVSSMDHKRAFDNNLGPNTGGMGVIAPNPHYSAEIAAECERTIFLPTIQAMEKEGCPFKGCLYFGLMLTPNGPKVIEYNCRFGDPETQAVIPLLESSLFDIMEAVTDGNLKEAKISFSNAHSACIVLASGGYPSSYKTGFPISGLDAAGGSAASGNTAGNGAASSGAEQGRCFVYHAGTVCKGGSFFTAGGRVLGVTATASELDLALEAAYSAAAAIHFEGMFYRKDIGRY